MKTTQVSFDDGQTIAVPRGWAVVEWIQGRWYEPEVTARLLGELSPDTVFVDVGAQLGYYTLLAAKRAKEVLAFEPRADMRKLLKANVRRNGHENVTVSAYALYSKKVEGYIGRAAPDGRQWPMFREGEPPQGKKAVMATTLDAYLRGRRVDLVKMDVEGAEYDALAGMQETLERHSPTLIVEVHHMMKYYGHQPADLGKLLSSMGYRWVPLNFVGGLEEGAAAARHIVARRA